LVMNVSHMATLPAHEVMMGDFLLHLEEPPSGSQMGLLDEPQTDKQLESTVDRGHVDVGELLLHLGAHFFGAHVGVPTPEYIPDEGPLRCQAIAQLLQGSCGVMRHCNCKDIAIA